MTATDSWCDREKSSVEDENQEKPFSGDVNRFDAFLAAKAKPVLATWWELIFLAAGQK